MKTTLLITILIFSMPTAQAGWFDRQEDPLQKKLAQVELELAVQRKITDNWVMLSGVLGICCVLLLITGTALGAKVRRHHEHQS